jgi:hypothetical protein
MSTPRPDEDDDGVYRNSLHERFTPTNAPSTTPGGYASFSRLSPGNVDGPLPIGAAPFANVPSISITKPLDMPIDCGDNFRHQLSATPNMVPPASPTVSPGPSTPSSINLGEGNEGDMISTAEVLIANSSSCDVCSKDYRSGKGLKSHRSNIHGRAQAEALLAKILRYNEVGAGVLRHMGSTMNMGGTNPRLRSVLKEAVESIETNRFISPVEDAAYQSAFEAFARWWLRGFKCSKCGVPFGRQDAARRHSQKCK